MADVEKPKQYPEAKQAWRERHPVQVFITREDGNLLDHHARAVGISRRQLAARVIQKYTADAARDIAREQEARARQAREELEGER